MRKLVLLLVALLAVPAMAGTITIDVVDNEDGTGTVRLTGISDAPPVGIGLIVDANIGTVANVNAPAESFFDVFPDFYNSDPCALDDDDFSDDGGHPGANPAGAGVQTSGSSVALSMGELDDANNADDIGLPINLAVINLGGAGEICITKDTLRGIVDVNVIDMTITNEGACFEITDGPVAVCPGDVTGTVTGYIPPTPFDPASFDSGLWTGPDGKTDTTDVQSLIYLLVYDGTGLVVNPVPTEATAGDVTGTVTGYIPPTPFDPASFDSGLWTGPDGKIDTTDVQALIYLLQWDGVSLIYTCP